MEVRDAVDAFIAWCRDRRAVNTVLLYRSRLRSFAEAFAGREISSLTRIEAEEWLSQAGRRPDGTLKAPDTRRATAIAFDQLQKWSLGRELLPRLLLEKIEKPASRTRDRIPTAEETARLLEKASPAFRLIYRALRQCGARPNELCRATIADWKRSQKAIVLVEHKTSAKTGKPRVIGVGAKLEVLLRESIGQRTEGPIFQTASGRPWTPQRLSSVYRELRNAAGLPKDLVLYLSRHEHGTKLTKSLGIYAAMDALGHTSIKTTQRYAHTTPEERAAAQDAFEE